MPQILRGWTRPGPRDQPTRPAFHRSRLSFAALEDSAFVSMASTCPPLNDAIGEGGCVPVNRVKRDEMWSSAPARLNRRRRAQDSRTPRRLSLIRVAARAWTGQVYAGDTSGSVTYNPLAGRKPVIGFMTDMIRFVLRFIGFWCLAASFVVIVVDGTRSIAASELVMSSALSAWSSAFPLSFNKAQTALSMLSPTLWTHLALPFLELPLFAVLAVLGVVLMVLGRPARRARGGIR